MISFGGMILIFIGVMVFVTPNVALALGIAALVWALSVFSHRRAMALPTKRPPHIGGWQDRAQRERPRLHSHAIEAFRRAGHEFDASSPLLPLDIGLIVYQEGHDPIVYHTQPIPVTADYIQPYMKLRLNESDVEGLVRFEIVDSDGQAVFIHEEEYSLSKGDNLIAPPAYFPVKEVRDVEAAWRVRISADGELMMEHLFTWQEVKAPKYIGADGEWIEEPSKAVVSDVPYKSLDDLLAMQPAASVDGEARRGSARHRLGSFFGRR